MPDRIAQFVRPEIRELNAYQVGDANQLIKMDNMENPYPWNSAITEAWAKRLSATPVNRYPDAEARALQHVLRQTMDIPAHAGLLLGNGSDELIQMVCLALAKPGATLVAPAPTFVMYKMLATFTQLNYRTVALNADFSLNTAAMLEEIEKTQAALVFLSYPNNPTGNLFDEQAICQIIEATPGVVIIDEAYFAFAESSFTKYLARYENMLIMRTVSKMGLAGLRLGYMLGAPAWIAEFNKVRLPFNINTLTQTSAIFALENKTMFDEQTARICSDRDRLFEAMQKMESIICYPSKANFILFKPKSGSGDALFAAIKKAGILIRNLGASDGALANCLRVTIGTEQENSAFLKALQESV
ncbi:MAG TPA: histidinol-phosphate transaminase [Gammaproteobacteria bacterium]|nr:histidinol-phosphate transaminase [Gammaproteobacteria bacterium]